MSEIIERRWAGAALALAEWPDPAATYLLDRRPPRLGSLAIRAPGAAAVTPAIHFVRREFQPVGARLITPLL